MLNAVAGRTTYTASAAFYVKLHTGSPGSAGTNNASAETTRQASTFGSTASGGSISNTADIQWTSYPANETISHVSFWDDSSAGNFLGADDLSVAKAMTSGDTLVLSAGQLTLSIQGALP